MTSPYPAPGDDIGRFRILSQLGAGGMGVVYDALEVNLQRRVALKVISPMFAEDADFRARFTKEARALASLDSTNVVQVYAHGEEDGYLYIATQLVPDGDLGQMIERWGPPPVGKACELIEQVASGLTDAHAAGLVHRDIKPANVLVRRRGEATVQAYLGDFGIARRVDADPTRVGGAAIGTPSYMAPELHGGAPASPASDIYALGCLLWIALTGRPPYGGTSEFEIVGGHISKPVPQLNAASPLVDHVNRILRLSMAKDPGDRYRSAVDLRDDLRAATRLTEDPAFYRLAADLPGSRLPSGGGSGAGWGSGTAARLATPSGPGAQQPPHLPQPPQHRTPTPSNPPGPPTPSGPVPVGQGGYGGSYQGYQGYPGQQGPPGQFGQGPTMPPGQGGYGFGGGTAGGGSYGTGKQGAKKTGVWVALAAVAVAVVIGGAFALLGGGDDSEEAGPDDGPTGTTTSATTSFADEDPTEILRQAEQEMRGLDAVRVTGQVDTGGQPGQLDMVITTSGDCDGTLVFGDGVAQIRKLGRQAWLKPDQAFLQASGVDEATASLVIDLVNGRWLKAEAEQVEQFNGFCDLDQVLGGDSSTGPSATSDGVVTIEGEDAVKLVLDDPTAPTVTYVAVDAPHYVLQIEVDEQDSRLLFSDFDMQLDVDAPAADEIYEVPQG